MFGTMGFSELIIILVIVLIIFGAGRLPQIEGQPPLLHNLPPGDAFAPRSPLEFSEEDASLRPELCEVEPGHWVQLSKSSVQDFEKYKHLISNGA